MLAVISEEGEIPPADFAGASPVSMSRAARTPASSSGHKWQYRRLMAPPEAVREPIQGLD
jgi:hypothetical protein